MGHFQNSAQVGIILALRCYLFGCLGSEAVANKYVKSPSHRNEQNAENESSGVCFSQALKMLKMRMRGLFWLIPGLGLENAQNEPCGICFG